MTGLKTRKLKSGLKSRFGCLSGQVGINRLFVVVGRDVGFGSPNRDRPDEIGTVGKYAVCILHGAITLCLRDFRT